MVTNSATGIKAFLTLFLDRLALLIAISVLRIFPRFFKMVPAANVRLVLPNLEVNDRDATFPKIPWAKFLLHIRNL
jgi:hypothetical protein